MDELKLPEYPIPWDLANVLNYELDVYSLSKRARVFSQVLDILKNVNYIDLSENHYLLLLKLGLYLEEYKKIRDMKKSAMSQKKIERPVVKLKRSRNRKRNKLRPNVISKIFHIPIGESMENKVFIKPGDFADFTANCKTYTLRVTGVTQSRIMVSDDEAKFYETFSTQKTFKIAFRLNNYSIRCAHFTLWLMHERNSVTYLFPFKNKPFVRNDSTVPACDLKLINPALESNPEQKQAVSNIVNRSSFPVPYILYGSPGTGKTTTLIEAIGQLHRIESTNILVCSSSNTAADEMTKMLLKFIPSTDIYRIYDQRADRLIIDDNVQQCANYENGEVTLPKYLDVVSKRIIITTLSDCMRLILIGIEASYFSHVIIDDADHAIEPEVLIPVSLVSESGKLHSQIVLAGDPQLQRLTVRSKIAKRILGRPILERLMSYQIYQKDDNNKYNPKYITKLLQNYRIYPDILQISNKLFYNNELIPKCERNVSEKFSVIFYGVESSEETESRTNSLYNPVEVDVVIDYVDDLLCNRISMGEVTTNDIGIITPFTAQSKKIKHMLKTIGKLENIKIGTIDCFQDNERKVMIMSTVKSKTFVENGIEHIGILSDAKLFNLALARASEFLIVIGNPIVLQVDNMWYHLIKLCLDNKSYDGIDFSLDARVIKGEENIARITAFNSSSLFKDALLKLFTLEEYYPRINYASIEYLSSITPHSNLVNPVGYWDTSTYTDDLTDYFASNNLYDHADSTSKDVFKNIDHFDVKEYIYIVDSRSFRNTESSRLNEIQKKAAVIDTFKNVCSFDHAAASNYSGVIKSSMDNPNNIIKGQISQKIRNFDHIKLEQLNHFQKTFEKKEGSLTEIGDAKNTTQNKLEKSSASITGYNKQLELPVDDTLNSNNSKKSFGKQENSPCEIIIPEKVNMFAINTSQKNLDFSMSDNVNNFLHTKFDGSSDSKKLNDKSEDFFCKINVCTTVSHVEHEQFEISSIKESQEKQRNILDSLNPQNRSEHKELRNSIDCNNPDDEQECLQCKNDNSEIERHSFHATFEKSITSKAMYDDKKNVVENDILDIKNLSICPKIKDSVDLKKLEDLECEANNPRTISDSNCVKNEDMNISKTPHGSEKGLFDIFENINNCKYTSLAEPRKINKCFNTQKELLLEDSNSNTESHYFNVESENSSIIEMSYDEKKSELEVDILKNVSYDDRSTELSVLEKCFSKHKEPQLEIDNLKSELHYAHIDLENSNVFEMSYHKKKDTIEDDILKIGSDCNFTSLNLIDLGELNIFFDKQEKLLLGANNCKEATHFDNIEYEHCYFPKQSCDDEKNLLRSSISETVQEPYYVAFVDSESEGISTNKQEDLIDFNCSIKNDDNLLNLITFEDTLEDSNTIPKNM